MFETEVYSYKNDELKIEDKKEVINLLEKNNDFLRAKEMVDIFDSECNKLKLTQEDIYLIVSQIARSNLYSDLYIVHTSKLYSISDTILYDMADNNIVFINEGMNDFYSGIDLKFEVINGLAEFVVRKYLKNNYYSIIEEILPVIDYRIEIATLNENEIVNILVMAVSIVFTENNNLRKLTKFIDLPKSNRNKISVIVVDYLNYFLN